MCRFEKKISENEPRRGYNLFAHLLQLITEFEIFRITKVAEHLNHFEFDSKSKNF